MGLCRLLKTVSCCSTYAPYPVSSILTMMRSSSTTRAQRASARNLTALGATEAVGEGVASSSHLAQDSDAPTMPLDIDDLTMSRSASVVQQDEPVVPSANKRPRRDKGKGREKEPIVKVKEEPVAVSLNVQEVAPALVSTILLSDCNFHRPSRSQMKIIVRRVAQMGLLSIVTGVPGHSTCGVSTPQSRPPISPKERCDGFVLPVRFVKCVMLSVSPMVHDPSLSSETSWEGSSGEVQVYGPLARATTTLAPSRIPASSGYQIIFQRW